jgi:Ca-activated chloride channel family protein
MRLLHPTLAIGFLSLPVILAAWYLHVRAKRRFRASAGLEAHLGGHSRFSTRRRDALALAAALVAAGAVTLALMRPQLMLERQVPEYEREDLILILDRSASMRAEDIRPTRFERALLEVEAFLREKPDTIDRVGLVGFASAAVMISYPTSDLGGLFFYLDWIREDAEPQYGTDMGAALESAREMARKDGPRTRKIFLLLSDGDEQGTDLPGVLASLRADGTPVYTIGIGSEGAVRIPLPPDVTTVGLLEEPLYTRFNETTLKDIATRTGGRYFRSETGSELAGAMRDIAERERAVLAYRTEIDYRDLYRESLAVAAAALFVLILTL